jgi:hypothetical protein
MDDDKIAPHGSPQLGDVTNAASSSEDVSSESARDLDDTYQVFKDVATLEVDEAEAKRVLRKIDFRVVPILFVTYLLQYLDKNSINFANTFGLQEGTNLKGQDYSWLGMCD